ncbi:MAG TPA: VRR-NUC domain-containing protein [Candidatus Cloacimonadota bacterium]|nr:VRR-NUC domain-containing protein [Candidatus Cloacimonadota bacterium]
MNEHEMQSNFFNWAKSMEEHIPELATIFAIPNAGKRSPGAARYYLQEGLKTGLPDVCLPIRREIGGKQYGALFIEFKSEHGKLTNNQQRMQQTLRLYGNMVVTVWSLASAVDVVGNYLASRDMIEVVNNSKEDKQFDQAMRDLRKNKIKKPPESIESSARIQLAPGISVEQEKIKRCKAFHLVEIEDPFGYQLYIFGTPEGESVKLIQVTDQLFGLKTAEEILYACQKIKQRLDQTTTK